MNTQYIILFLCFLIFVIYFSSLSKENFEDEGEDNIKKLTERMNMNQFKLNNQLTTLNNETEKTKQETEQLTPPYSPDNFNVYSVPNNNVSENFQTGNSEDINKMFDNLNRVESICKTFEDNVNKRDEDTANKIRDKLKEQIDKEEEKILELEELVNVFRQQYLMKEAINYKCTAEKQQQIDSSIQSIADNKENYQDRSPQIDLVLKDPEKKAVIETLKQFKNKKKFKVTETDSE